MSSTLPITKVRRNREVRDIFNKLRKTYNPETVERFFQQNYFLLMPSVYEIVRQSDEEAVDFANASLMYTIVMDSTFKI